MTPERVAATRVGRRQRRPPWPGTAVGSPGSVCYTADSWAI